MLPCWLNPRGIKTVSHADALIHLKSLSSFYLGNGLSLNICQSKTDLLSGYYEGNTMLLKLNSKSSSFNWLWPIDTMWCHRTQIMAWGPVSVTKWQFDLKFSRYQTLMHVRNLLIWNCCYIIWGVNELICSPSLTATFFRSQYVNYPFTRIPWCKIIGTHVSVCLKILFFLQNIAIYILLSFFTDVTS